MKLKLHSTHAIYTRIIGIKLRIKWNQIGEQIFFISFFLFLFLLRFCFFFLSPFFFLDLEKHNLIRAENQ